jgi:SAM-dependent methyltransferase
VEVHDYVIRNRDVWNQLASVYAESGRRNWAGEPSWGVWGLPESEVGMLTGVAGKDVLEDGCGTAYVSAWIARSGGRPIGIDNSPAQLATARRFQIEHDLDFPLVHTIAERLPFADGSFDVVISEYGAAIWSDPYRWVPEASRVLRPGGELVFLGNSTLLMMCVPDYEGTSADRTLQRDHFGMHRFEWPDGDEVEFHLGPGSYATAASRSSI